MKKENNYNYIIDLLKFIFSFIIVLYHSWSFNDIWGVGYFQYGYMAVDFYFIVTGYLMMNSINKQEDDIAIGSSTLYFIKNKIFNIFPYILAAYICGLLFLYKNNLFGISNIFQNNYFFEIIQLGILGTGFPVNSATWYISAMLFTLFILYPLAKKYKTNYLTLIVPLMLIFFLLIVYSFNININDPLAKNLFFYNGFYKSLIFILLGNSIYTVVEKIKKVNFSKIGTILITLLEVILYGIAIYTMYFNIIGTALFAIIILLAISITFSSKSLTAKYLNFKFFKKLGMVGFIMYLNNVYVRNYFIINKNNLSYNETLWMYLVIVIIISTIMYILVPLLTKVLKKIYIKISNLLIEKS